MDDGEVAIDNAEVLAQVRRQARKVQAQTLAVSVALTILFLALPEMG